MVKLYWGVQFGYDFWNETVLGVCFGYKFHVPKHTPGIFVHSGIYLPVTPGNRSTYVTTHVHLS